MVVAPEIQRPVVTRMNDQYRSLWNFFFGLSL